VNDPRTKLSIVVITHNSQAVLRPFVESLSQALGNQVAQLIFVDNNSSDNSIEIVSELLPAALVIRNDDNRGFARAVNQGGKEAKGDWLLLLNPDLILSPDCIANLLDHASRYERLGLATGRISHPDGTFQAVCRHLPSYQNLIFSRGFFLGRWLGRSRHYTLGDFKEDTPVPAIAGTVLLTRRSVWEQLGGFDERFFMFMEDTDLSLRATRLGLTNYYFPTAQATHEWGRGSSISSIRRKQLHHQSMWLYFRKHHSVILAWTIVPLVLLLNLMLSILFKPEERGRA
jgi:hypothetical protein